jgi:predicted nucleotidyltransferase
MANILNEDFTDFIKALNNSHVEYILVGGYAVIYHGYNRTTGDLDIWVNPTPENFKRLELAFSIFGMSLFGITEDKFLNIQSYDVFTYGRPPVCIEILTKVKGLDFKSTFSNSVFTKFDGIDVQMIDIRDLRIAKSAANRPKDNDDLHHLT